MSIGAVGNSQIPPSFDAPVAQDEDSGPSTFDILTRLALPLVLGAIAYFRTQPWWFWGLVAIAFLPVGLSLYPRAKTLGARWLGAWRDRRRVRQALPAFERYVARFGRFIGSDSTNKLTEVVESQHRRNNLASSKELGMVQERVLQGFWQKLAKRIDGQDLGFEDGLRAVEEFNHLLHTYLRETIEPVFDQMPPQERDSLSPEAKRELEAFRETLMQYVHSYDSFATELAETLETYHLSTPNLDPPKPHA